jgi:hypothetical protein
MTATSHLIVSVRRKCFVSRARTFRAEFQPSGPLRSIHGRLRGAAGIVRWFPRRTFSFRYVPALPRENLLFQSPESSVCRRPKPLQPLWLTDPGNQRTSRKTAVASAFTVDLRSVCCVLTRVGRESACGMADRTRKRTYSPKANAITSDEQNRKSPSIVPSCPLTISQPSNAKTPTTTTKLNRNKKARSDIVNLGKLSQNSSCEMEGAGRSLAS